MDKVIEGYISRDEYNQNILFSDKPFQKDGFLGDGEFWYDILKKEEDFPLDFRVDLHKYMDIPELRYENSPRYCKITIEIGEQLEGNNQEELDKKHQEELIDYRIERLASELPLSKEEIKERLGL